ncbi:MAG TPA: hypothetical protein VHN59_03570 [Chitinophagaceae bacterium]|nr:hypothetical protein [Chitinophagaceae bacterium]
MNKKIASLLITAIITLLAQPILAQEQRVRNNKNTVVTKPSTDTVVLARTVLKELAQELPADKNAVIKIVNTTCNLDIRPWAEAKVRMVTAVYVAEEKADKITPEEIMENAGIIFKSFGNRVDVQTRASFANERPSLYQLYKKVSDANGNVQQVIVDNSSVTSSLFDNIQSVKWNITGPDSRQKMTLYIPKGSKLDIDNKNTSVIINDDINDARFKLNHSNLDARNFGKVYITAEYFTINISDAQEAELELENGNFTGGILQTLDLDSKASEIDYESGMSLYLRSQNDRITVDQIAKVAGRKLYGDLRIGKLITELDIEGLNADIRVRNISPLAEKVKIIDQYADLRLPVKNIVNYAVLFKGEKSTVFTPFEKVAVLGPVVTKEEQKTTGKPGTTRKSQMEIHPLPKEVDGMTPAERQRYLFEQIKKDTPSSNTSFLGERAPSQFKASNGDTTGKHTRFDITCNQCSVDFK